MIRLKLIMKKTRIYIFILLALITNLIKAQEIYPYEKQINNIQNYISTEIETENLVDNVILKGTLIEPKTKYAQLVIIVPGSGKDTRNSHYKLTEKLLENNIAVYRYDERGCGLSTGKFNTVSYNINDLTNDLHFIYNNIKKQKFLNTKKIGLIGHSIGGMATIGLLDKNVVPDFLIQWATPIQKGGEFLKYQLITGVNNYDDELIFDTIEEKINVIEKINKVVFENRNDENTILIQKVKIVSNDIEYRKKNYKTFTYANFPSTKELIKKNFEPNYKNSTIKILYVIGENDQYVDASKETTLLKSFANNNVEIKKFMNFNHYLKNGTENVENMYEIENEPVNYIINWIIKQ